MQLIRTFLLVLLMVVAIGGISLEASESGRRAVKQLLSVESERQPLVFKSAEAVENPSRLLLCEKALLQMASRLQLTDWKKIRFEIIWNEDLPNSHWVDTFPRSIGQDEDGWIFTIKGQGNWKDGKEQLYRTLAICVLQSRMLPEKGKLGPNNLPDPPLWLSEGLTQTLMESRREDFAYAVWRFSLSKKVPSLESIQQWEELSPDGIRRSWQQAFSFWLFTQATRNRAEKVTLQSYLSMQLKDPGRNYWTAEATNEEWWQRSTSVALKQQIPGLNWQQSVARLRDSTFFTVRYTGDEGERLISITELPKSTASLQSLKPVDELALKLADLELNAHALIQPVAGFYRRALEAWSSGNIDEYARNLRAARDWQKEATQVREKANDFLDWFTVNYELDINNADHRNYARTVEKLENARKDLRRKEMEKTTTQ